MQVSVAFANLKSAPLTIVSYLKTCLSLMINDAASKDFTQHRPFPLVFRSSSRQYAVHQW